MCVWDWEQFVTLACLAWRWQARADLTSGSNLCPARLAVLEAGEPPHASTPLFDVATGPLMESVVIPAAAPFDQMLRAMATARPTHLVGYASVIGRLARAAIAGELKIRPVRVSTNSEPLSEEDRDVIEVAWGAPVDNLGADRDRRPGSRLRPGRRPSHLRGRGDLGAGRCGRASGGTG